MSGGEVVAIIAVVLIIFMIINFACGNFLGIGGNKGKGKHEGTGDNTVVVSSIVTDTIKDKTQSIVIEGDNIFLDNQQVSLDNLISEMKKTKDVKFIHLVDRWAVLKTYDDVYDQLDQAGIKVIQMNEYK